ncbi:hypothetical protein O9929_16930 [Vibrio lentus]|nr:hypothetical protein [Vibrio lentus]
MLNDVSSLEQAHQTEDIAENEQEFLENIFKKKNDHFKNAFITKSCSTKYKESIKPFIVSKLSCCSACSI